MKKIIIFGLFGFLVIPMVFINCSSENEIRTTDSADSTTVKTNRPDQIYRNTNYSLLDGARKTANIKADSLYKFEKLDSTMAWNLDVRSIDSTGQEIASLVADSGVIREKTHFMNVFGHVVVVTNDSTILMTEHLFYNARNDKIITDEYIKIIRSDGSQMEGYGFEGDLLLKEYEIKDQPTGAFHGSDKILE